MLADLLRTCLEETKPPSEIYIETERLFTRNRDALIPLDEIFRLDRHALYADAKATLPFWKSLPFIVPIGIILKKLFAGVKKGAESIKDPPELYSRISRPSESHLYVPGKDASLEGKGGADSHNAKEAKEAGSTAAGRKGVSSVPSSRTSKKRLKEYHEAVNKLKIHYVGGGGSLKEEADALIGRWNPLVTKDSRQNLVEDVNSMIRDYIRGMKRGSVKPPDSVE